MMTTVRISQGAYRGFEKNGIRVFHAIPYSGPYERFGSPTKPVAQTDDGAVQDATQFGAICPQFPSRLAIVVGPTPPGTGPQDEINCGILSIYSPAPQRSSSEKLPVIVWVHGGAFVGQGSQIPYYDGSRLARDGNVVVVAINYRLGVFGFLYDEDKSWSSNPHPDKKSACGVQDVIAAFEWVRENVEAFGGDSKNITAFGQSAGGYLIQLLLDQRPDLFEKAILQSSPAKFRLTLADAQSIRQGVVDALPSGKTLTTASTQEMLQAQLNGMRNNAHVLAPFCPIVGDETLLTSSSSSTSRLTPTTNPKSILIGWTKDDASVFAAMGLTAAGLPPWMLGTTAYQLSPALTKKLFSTPARKLGDRWRKQNHHVTLFELEWGPEDFDMGVVHCADLPLVFGDEESWKASPVVQAGDWEDWERVGKGIRSAWGRFAKEGSFKGFVEGLNVVEA